MEEQWRTQTSSVLGKQRWGEARQEAPRGSAGPVAQEACCQSRPGRQDATAARAPARGGGVGAGGGGLEERSRSWNRGARPRCTTSSPQTARPRTPHLKQGGEHVEGVHGAGAVRVAHELRDMAAPGLLGIVAGGGLERGQHGREEGRGRWRDAPVAVPEAGGEKRREEGRQQGGAPFPPLRPACPGGRSGDMALVGPPGSFLTVRQRPRSARRPLLNTPPQPRTSALPVLGVFHCEKLEEKF